MYRRYLTFTSAFFSDVIAARIVSLLYKDNNRKVYKVQESLSCITSFYPGKAEGYLLDFPESLSQGFKYSKLMIKKYSQEYF